MYRVENCNLLKVKKNYENVMVNFSTGLSFSIPLIWFQIFKWDYWLWITVAWLYQILKICIRVRCSDQPAVTYAASQHQGRLFWITCKWLKLLKKAGRLQLFQTSAPFVAGWRQCCIRIRELFSWQFEYFTELDCI